MVQLKEVLNRTTACTCTEKIKEPIRLEYEHAQARREQRATEGKIEGSNAGEKS